MRARGFKRYITTLENYLQVGMNVLNICIIITIACLSNVLIVPNKYAELYNPILSLRVIMVLALLFNTVELFIRVRIFDFFAYFVRQLTEIVEDAVPLGAMLGLIVLTQTLLFWVLDQNSS